MRWLLCTTICLAALASSGVADAQRGTGYHPPPRVETYRPPPQIETYEPPRQLEIRPAPRLETNRATVPVPPPYAGGSADGDGGSDDDDGDGYTYDDCNDYDSAVHPGAAEGPGERDMNCNGHPYY